MEHKAQEWRQYLIASVGGISFLISGFNLGWTAPINIKLVNPDETPLPELITVDEEAWIGSLLPIGAIFGSLMAGFAVTKLGRKWALTTACVPLLISGILNAIANDVVMLYVARLFSGLYVGLAFATAPMYLGEIATTTSAFFLMTGFLIVYSIGPYVSYYAVAYVGIAMGLCFFTLTLLLPESPYFYLAKGDINSAGDCLVRIRGNTREGVQSELDKIAIEVNESMKNSATLIDVFRGTNFKAMYISCALMTAQQLCGINAVIFYMTNIYEAAGTDLDSAISTIITGAAQVVASPLAAFLVDRAGRRILVLSSSFGMGTALVLLGVFFYLEQNESPILKSIGFLPLMSLMMFVFMYVMGVGPVPFNYMAEVMPVEVKGVASSIATSYCWILSFMVTRFFGPVAEAVGMAFTFWIFAVCCFLSFVFTWFCMPETMGKSFQEIQDLLKKGSKRSS